MGSLDGRVRTDAPGQTPLGDVLLRDVLLAPPEPAGRIENGREAAMCSSLDAQEAGMQNAATPDRDGGVLKADREAMKNGFPVR
ncbi:hypothetical protein [Oleisolibacter albus]|uniref:hypothetical protein n=1 Tax=Oleisolibacter albus TaxID=2171757 RepID=UPI0012D7CBA5|nr:hypothetical protein [Oleisolibacter albus]